MYDENSALWIFVKITIRSGGLCMVNLDITIVIQFVNLCISLSFLHFLIIKPIRENVALRVKESVMLTEEIETLSFAIERKMQKYREDMDIFQNKLDTERMQRSLDAEKEALRIVTTAKEEKQERICAVESLLQSSFATANKELLAKKEYFVDCIIQKIM
ncbi:MAG: hypothetical protein ACRCV3_00820 [Desulfovibrionaceae bacterium]